MNIAASTVPAAWHAAVSFGLVRVEFLINTIFHRSCAQNFKAFDEAKQNKQSQAYSPTGVRQIDWLGETAFMGQVRRARHDRLGRPCPQSAQPSPAQDQDRSRRVAIMNSPCAGAPYIVSELLEGQTLRQQLFEGPLPCTRRPTMGMQIVHGSIAAYHKLNRGIGI
jgi:hypothetical protein